LTSKHSAFDGRLLSYQHEESSAEKKIRREQARPHKMKREEKAIARDAASYMSWLKRASKNKLSQGNGTFECHG
jgi:hypothetical protein